MSPQKNPRGEEIKEKIQELIRELDIAHKHLRELNRRIEELETKAGDAGLDRVKFALRDAYVKVSQSGSKLVEAHMDMTIPATVYKGNQSE